MLPAGTRCPASTAASSTSPPARSKPCMTESSQVPEHGAQRPVVAADAGYGDNTCFRLELAARGWQYAVAVKGTTSACPHDAVPETMAYGGLGRPSVPRYRARPLTLRQLAIASADQVQQVTPRPGQLGGRPVHGLAPPRPPRRPRPGVLHHDPHRPKSPYAGMTLYQALHELQIVLALILGACPLCRQPLTLDRLAAALAGT